MSSPDGQHTRLRILHLEEDAFDGEKASAMLAAHGLTCDIQRVSSRSAFEAALITKRFDVILTEVRLRDFDGVSAQGVVRRVCPDTPLIFLSDTDSDELVAERLEQGAVDFVSKDRLKLLPIAVRRAHREVVLREANQSAETHVRRLRKELATVRPERADALGESPKPLGPDITCWHQLLQAVLDESPMAIYVHDLEGRYLLVNREGERVLGYAGADMLGKSVHDIMPPRLADIVQAHHLQVLRDNCGLQFEESVLEHDGVHVLASMRFPLNDSDQRQRGTCCISQDITAKKRVEGELQLARLEALRANRAKSKFLSQMSHELRTPLNAILGFAQLLELEQLEPSQAENVCQILSGGGMLLELINEVLDINRVESGKLTLCLEAVDAVDAVNDSVNLVRPLAAKCGVDVEVQELSGSERAVLADRQRLGQVLRNLLSNAVKYNRPEGRAMIRFSTPTPGQLRISVADTGAGIPPSKLKLLFQPFERLGADRAGIDGTGLGLALSEALCHAMHGTLGVESVVDCGSTFWVELPLAGDQVDAADAGTPGRASGAVTPADRGTIVYLEDNPSNVRLMERILAHRPGVTLRHAPDARTGLELVWQHRPDLVVLDWHLPDASGDEVLRRLAGDERSRHVPVAVLTADATPGLPRRLSAGQAAAFLLKPIDVRVALGVFDDLLSQRQGVECHG